MEKVCYWSVGTGDYAYMLANMVHSFRSVGMKEDFHAFTDQPIPDVYQHDPGKLEHDQWFFKLKYLKEKVFNWDYDLFVYLDADTYWTHAYHNIEDRLNRIGCRRFCALESDLCSPLVQHRKWRKFPVPEVVKLYQKCGVTHSKIYNINGGLFAVFKDDLMSFCDDVNNFRKDALAAGWNRVADENCIGFAVQKTTPDTGLMTISKNPGLWACDTKVFNGRLPIDCSWQLDLYLGGSLIVNPAIVHQYDQKKFLIESGKRLLQNKRGQK